MWTLTIKYMYIVCMSVEFDPAKATANFRKHGIRLPDAEIVLYDPFALTIRNGAIQDEERFVTIGLDAIGRVLVVVYTFRGENLRLISARRATPTERKRYEKRI